MPMGWQFTAAEFVGGPIMIVLLAAHRRNRDRPTPGRAAAARRGLAGAGTNDHLAMATMSGEHHAQL